MVKKNIIILTMILYAYAITAYAQDAVAADTLVGTVQSDSGDGLDVFDSDDVSLSDSAAMKKTDSLTVKKKDSFDDFDSDEDLEIADAPADSAAAAQKLGGVKRGYDRNRQVKLAIVMMVFLILALGTSQSFNPR